MGRKRGVPLSRPDVIEAAIACIAEEGPTGLGINRVARALGIQPPSLYHHVASHEDLARQVAIEGWRRLGAAMANRPKATEPRARIESLGMSFRRFVSEHPGLYQVMSDTPLHGVPDFHPVGAAIMDDFAQVLSTFGLDEAEVVDAVRMLRATLHGFVLLEKSGQFGMPHSVERSFQWLLAHLSLMLERSSGR